jgi:hypothetical protein
MAFALPPFETCFVTAMKLRTFGSSRHKESGQWQVWSYDNATDRVEPMATFVDQVKAETSAFDLAHAAAKGREAECKDEIVRQRDFPPIGFHFIMEVAIKALIQDTVDWSNEPESGKCEVAVRRTELDQIFVVTFPRDDKERSLQKNE